MIFDYILCYGVAFCFGMLAMCFVLYFINQDRIRKREILRKRKQQLERDNRGNTQRHNW